MYVDKYMSADLFMHLLLIYFYVYIHMYPRTSGLCGFLNLELSISSLYSALFMRIQTAVLL